MMNDFMNGFTMLNDLEVDTRSINFLNHICSRPGLVKHTKKKRRK